MKPKISVVIPYFNRELTLLRALRSVSQQTYKNLELILIDDGSTDNSWLIVGDYIRSNPSIPAVHLKQINSGPAAARNLGIAHATGEYIAFLDSDDSWEPNKLAVQMAVMNDYHADLVSCNSNVISGVNHSKKFYTRKLVEKIDYRKALLKYYTSTPCVVVKKSVIQAVGGFPENMHIGEDMVVFYRIIRQYSCFVSGEFLTNIHKDLYGQSGLTSDLWPGFQGIIRSIRIAKNEDVGCLKKIGLVLYATAMLFATLNYFKRTIVVSFNRIQRTISEGNNG